MIKLKKIRYPELNPIIRMYPNPEILLGHEIFWQEKRDGCLPSWVKITTNNGDIPIGQIVNQKLDVDILTYNEETKLCEFSRILNYHKAKHKHQYIQIRLKRYGKFDFSIVTTDNHLFKTQEHGWIEAKNTNVGDSIFLKGNEIPYIQKQIILGILLGDGYVLQCSSGRYGFSTCHSMSQWDYLFLQNKLLGDLVRLDKNTYRGGYKGSLPNKRITSSINLELSSFIEKHCIMHNKKRITKNWAQYLAPISLAFWYMDDGSFGSNTEKQRGYATFHTQSYSEDECILLIKTLKEKFNIDAIRRKDKAIHLTTKGSEILFSLIAPYIPSHMQYKLSKRYRTGKCFWDDYKHPNKSFQLVETKIIGKTYNISKWRHITEKTYEYDIETKNHNYFANRILIHNSNIGVRLSKGNRVYLRSRNQSNASKDFYKYYKDTEEASNIKQFLIDMRDEWGTECVVFGELLVKGKSPTRTEFHEKNEFIVFDIWSAKADGFLPYMLVHQYCYQYKLPIVELYGTSKHKTLKSLLKFRDKMLDVAKEKKREGVVAKIFVKGVKFKYFKERLDLPKISKLPRHIEDGKPQLPALPESEILGALDKVFVDLGKTKFKDISTAMPLFAKYIKIECRKHNCDCRDKLFKYYKQKLEENV